MIYTGIFFNFFNFHYLLVTFIGEDDLKLQLYGVIHILLAISTIYDEVITFEKIAIKMILIGINVIR